MFDSWLTHKHIADHRWILERPVRQPDFISPNGIRIGVETVKRRVAPQERYTAQITRRHSVEPADLCFFMSYDFTSKKMWLLGGIDQSRFLQEAQIHRGGDAVHADHKLRPGHEILNIEMTKLVSPEEWVGAVIGEPGGNNSAVSTKAANQSLLRA